MAVMLMVIATLVTGLSVTRAQAPSVSNLDFTTDEKASLIREASRRFAIPITWLERVIQVESAGKSRAVSTKGALGLMQLMPRTYAGLKARYGLGSDPLNPRDNVLAGAAYLREMYDRYGSPGFLAAYNAGPARVESFLVRASPLPFETRVYLSKLAPIVERTGSYLRTSTAAVEWSTAPIFSTRPGNASLISPSKRARAFGYSGVSVELFAQPTVPGWGR